jgi:phosphonopyruvate decarboxylase
MTREQALAILLDAVGPRAVLVSTTGKTSREIFELREGRGEGHERDFLTVGSMGHTASIALGVALGTNRRVYCVDGDGSFLMHMGSLAVAAQHWPANLTYVLINNGAHESVGGQPTVGLDIDVAGVLRAVGFEAVDRLVDEADLRQALQARRPRPAAVVVEVRQSSRADLGRPTTTPAVNKTALMGFLSSGTSQ